MPVEQSFTLLSSVEARWLELPIGPVGRLRDVLSRLARCGPVVTFVIHMQNEPQPNPDRLPPRIGLVAMDFDGVLTDDRVIVGEDGREQVICSRADGLGLTLLIEAGFEAVILSSETNPVVTARARKLNIPVHQGLGLGKKHETLRKIAADRNVRLTEVVYIGNDVNDAECLRLAGCAVVPADAHPHVVGLADIVLTRPAGRGAIRELADMILAKPPPKHRSSGVIG